MVGKYSDQMLVGIENIEKKEIFRKKKSTNDSEYLESVVKVWKCSSQAPIKIDRYKMEYSLNQIFWKL